MLCLNESTIANDEERVGFVSLPCDLGSSEGKFDTFLLKLSEREMELSSSIIWE